MNLTTAQVNEIKILMRLGDSYELACKTVTDKPIVTKEEQEFYYNCYFL